VTVYYEDRDITLLHGDVREQLATIPADSVQCVVTSPPYYGLRDYGHDGQIGLEASPDAYVETMRAVFADCRRVLVPDGVLWLNLGDSYNAYNGNRGESATGFSRNGPMPSLPRGAGLTAKGIGPKNLLGMPWRVAFSLQADGWTLRNAVIWHKPNAMPESVTDRLSTRYEHVFLFARSARYRFNLKAIWEPLKHPSAADGSRAFGGKNKAADLTTGSSDRRTGNVYDAVNDGKNPGDLWTIPTQHFAGAHFATMPPALARRCILAGSHDGATVLDPFVGSGTVPKVARQLGRLAIGIDLIPEYLDIAVKRIGDPTLEFEAAS